MYTLMTEHKTLYATRWKAFSKGDGGREANMGWEWARHIRLYGVWSYQKTQSCVQPTLQFITYTNTLTWKHWNASQCDLFVLSVQWTEAVEVVTVWWQALWRHYVTPVTVYSVHVRKRGFVTLQWLRHSFSPVHLSTEHSQLQGEKWTREMWICLHVKCHRAACSMRLNLGFNSTVKQVLKHWMNLFVNLKCWFECNAALIPLTWLSRHECLRQFNERFFLFHSYSDRQLETKLRSLDSTFSLQKRKFCLLFALTFCPASYSPRPIRGVLIGSPLGWMLLALWLGIELACWLGIEGVKTDERIWLSFLLQTSLLTLTLKESRAGSRTRRRFCSA